MIRKVLDKCDIYSVTFDFFYKGNRNKTSVLGIVASLVCVLLTLFFSFMFGIDIFFRLNPRFITSTKVPPEYAYFEPTNANFPIAFRLGDIQGATFSPEDAPLFPIGVMYRNRTDKEGKLITELPLYFEIKKCSEIYETNPVGLEFLNMEFYYCLDLDGLKTKYDTELKLGGFFDTTLTLNIGVEFYSCRFEEATRSFKNCLSWEEVEKRIGLRAYTQVLYPSAYADSSSIETPLKVQYENILYTIQKEVLTSYRILYQYVTLEDDQGWLFEDKQHYEKIVPFKMQTEFSMTDKDNFTGHKTRLFSFYFYLLKERLEYKRSYMKVQELGALIGGFIKILTVFVTGILSPILTFIKDRDVVLYMEPNTANKRRVVSESIAQVNKSVKSVVSIANNREAVAQITVGAYLKSLFQRNSSKDRNIKRFETVRQEIYRKLDVTFYLKICEQLTKMKEDSITKNNFIDL